MNKLDHHQELALAAAMDSLGSLGAEDPENLLAIFLESRVRHLAPIIRACKTCHHWQQLIIGNSQYGECEITGPDWRYLHPNSPIQTQDHEGASAVITRFDFGCNAYTAVNQSPA